MKFFDPSCLLRLSVLLAVVHIYIHTHIYLVAWSFLPDRKVVTKLNCYGRNLYAVYSGKKYVTT